MDKETLPQDQNATLPETTGYSEMPVRRRDFFNPRNILALLLVIGLIAIIGLTTLLALRNQETRTRASNENVSLIISPDKTDFLPGKEITSRIIINAGNNKIMFARVAVKFDNQTLRIKNKPRVNTSFPDLVYVSTAAEANSSGEIIIAAGAKNKSLFQTGVIDFAQIKFEAKNPGGPVENDNVFFHVADSQIVNLEAVALNNESKGARYSVSYFSPTPTSNPTNTVSPSVTKTNSPSPTQTPTVTPKKPTPSTNPEATFTPTPTCYFDDLEEGCLPSIPRFN